MSKKTITAGRKATAPTSQTSKAKAKTQHAPTNGRTTKRDASMPQRAVSGGRGANVTAVAEPRPSRPVVSADPQTLPANILAKAEANIAAAIESMNNQMNAAMATMTELAAAQRGTGEDAYLRTAPLDRATATFQRLVGEVLDDHLVEMLPTLVSLRGEMADKAHGGTGSPRNDDEFYRRGTEMLDQVLSAARVSRFDARTGEAFDPLIHLAVGETHRPDLADGAVAEFLQPGFRTARGKVIAPAKVKVNRR
jgi:hypothetical protein